MMEKCMRCSHDLIINGNYMLSDLNEDLGEEDDDVMVTNAHCPHCGASYEIVDTPQSERKNYPYWNVI
jgi:DNA-directed RNA polymerase subunit RPC12/RpoP